MLDDDLVSRELVIIRRRQADEGSAVKGGAWKIAYADFVTAMMAFFLVMWLINASNEATRAQVASYFNPIKLIDSTTGRRGLKDVKQIDAESRADDKATEAALLDDPAKALNRISRTDAPQASKDMPAVKSSDAMGSVRTAEQYPGIGDPFDPRSWDNTPDMHAQDTRPVPTNRSETSAVEESKQQNESESAPVVTKPATATGDVEAPLPRTEPPERTATRKEDTEAGAAASTALEVKDELAAQLAIDLDKLPASIEIRVVPQGVLISLADRELSGLFKTGSAEPEANLLPVVEAIGHVLSTRPGYVVVRGHTDSRPFRNRKYDNWQLSTARAHFAQYMLIRGGLDEARLRRVEGVADREPRVAGDGNAPENRRIEILLGLDGQ